MMFNKETALVLLKTAIGFVYISASSAANISNGNDPFIQRWDYFDGIKTYTLNITKSNAPGQDYHIDYTFSAGRSATDMCTVISNTSFKCITGERVTRDDVAHSVKIDSSSGAYVYYDPNYLPPTNSLLGNWVMNYQRNDYNVNFQISIMSSTNDKEVNVITSESDSTGGHCSYNVPDVYHITENPDGTKIFTDANDSQKKFKYDPQTNQITNPNPTKNFVVGHCVWISDSWGQVLFTKP